MFNTGMIVKDMKGGKEDMTEKRFVYYEHKGADYILDTPNKSLDVTIDVVDEYIKFWSDDGVQEFYYDISPIEVVEELKTTLITGEYPTKMVEE